MAEGVKTDKKPGRYDFKAIEDRWQAYWAENEVFRTPNPGEAGADISRPKFYILDMFPYPSGAGLHVGHPLGYCATDIVSRYKRMRGFNVLHPMGFDSFGLPAEQYAIEHNVHPAVTTRNNIEMYRRQLKMFGFSYDWNRELATSDPQYYKFTQWCFARMFESWYDEAFAWTDPQGKPAKGKARPIAELIAEFEKGNWGVDVELNIVRTPAPGRREWSQLSETDRRQAINHQRLAYVDEIPVNWCPALGTVLANEEVDNEGRSERGGHPVFRRPLRQWMLRITKYAERLLSDIDELDWPEPIKLMQRNWVGRSVGAEVVFPRADKWSIQNNRWRSTDPTVDVPQQLSYTNFPHAIRVYTTRPDTLFGATYMVLAPEHELVAELTTPDRKAEVEAYVARARNRSDLERTAESKEKTGVFTGGYAINPVNGWKIPVWVADYVLMGYGTGAIMAVPAGDTRDFEFAKKFDLPIVPVVRPPDEWLREQLYRGAFDHEFAEAKGRGEAIKRLMSSAISTAGLVGGVTAQNATAVLDGDDGWIRQVLHPLHEEEPGVFAESFTGEGEAINSPGKDTDKNIPGGVCRLNGTPTAQAKQRITQWLESAGVGRGAVNYKLRDWVFSRQKYWGEPFPVLHGEDGETIAVPDDELPVELPPMEDFKPTPVAEDDPHSLIPEPPLARAKEWVRVDRNGKRYRRDVNTMPQWAGSCWYYLRFIDPWNESKFCDPQAEHYWMPVDLYVGGAEHAVLHLLYARFWHKVLFDLGHVSTREPFQKLFNQGMIQGFAFRDARGLNRRPDEVQESGEDRFVLKGTGESVTRVIAKMSKSLKNVVNPDEIIAEYGADTFRMYEMYMGPLDAAKPWNTRDVPGLFKLCQRIWRLVVDESTGNLSPTLTDEAPGTDILRVLHQTIQRVTEDIEALKFNTAIAALFDFVNMMTPLDKRPRAAIEPFVLLVSPFAPHLAEELWNRLGHDKTLAFEPWPAFDAELARETQIEIAVQISGKVKARIMVPADADETAMRETALADAKVKSGLEGKTVRKVIVIPGRLVNIVAN
ncbi:MAG: leucine--tRNA ligase [Phycisphaerae bacterium]|nr:leucine--tRNA ligase [Phycisphaerae bacterium]